MFKKKSKLLILLVIAILLLSTLCFATDETSNTVNENERTATPTSDEGTMPINEEENTITEGTTSGVNPEDIHNNNLTIFENDIKMDKLVDGNVYLFGNNIEVSGQVNGNLFAFGNNITFTDQSYIINSVYVCANTLEFRGLCSDLNVFANKVNIPFSTESCFIFRDLNICANSFTFAGGVGRNANVYANTFKFASEENASGLVYGNLTYFSTNELELSEGLVEGSIKYSKINETATELSTSDIIINKLISLGSTLLYVFVVYILALLVAPKFVNKSNAKLFNILPALGIGILSIFTVILLFFISMYTIIGVHLGFVMLVEYILLFAIAFSIFAIYVANALKPLVDNKIKIDTKWKFAILLLLVALIMWILQQIPYIKSFVTIIILISGVGLFFMNIFGNLKKEKTANEISNS